MYKKLLTVCLLPVVCWALAGCGAERAELNPSPQAAPDVQLMSYFDDVISLDGQVRFRQGENNTYKIYADTNGRQQFVLETVRSYDYERISKYGQPIITATAYRIYDLRGALLHEVTIAADCEYEGQVGFAASPDADWHNSRIGLNRLAAEGCFRILDVEGNLLAEEQLLPADSAENLRGNNIWLDIHKNFMTVYCSYGTQDEWLNRTFFYALDGQPLTMAQDYLYLYDVYDWYNNRQADFFTAYYVTDTDCGLFDILDANGQVVVSGCSEVDYNYTDGVFEVVRGFSRGLVDTQGEWIYQESIFNDIED